MEGEVDQVQLVFVPMPEVGHMASMVELARRLLHLRDNLTITILTPTVPFSTISSPPPLPTCTNLNFIDLPYLDSPELRQVSGTACYSLVAKLLKPTIQDTLSSNPLLQSKVNGFVFDFSFIIPMLEVASEMGIQPYVYFPSNAAMFALLLHLATLEEPNLKKKISVLPLPGLLDPVPVRVLPAFIWEGYDVQGYNCMLNNARKLSQLRGVIINTLPELEAGVTKLLPLDHRGSQPPTIIPVGPVLDLDGRVLHSSSSKQPSADNGVNGVQESHKGFNIIMEWLDGQPPRSVVFLCFGSRGAFGPGQVREMAQGLEQSGHRFLWCLRRPPTSAAHLTPADYINPSEVLPDGFLDRTAGRGLVCGWVPQGKVLGHAAIGGFVSHCGWNSVLESLWCGVPILAWPIYAEQRLNAHLLVQELGLAHHIKPNYLELECSDLFEAYTDGGDRVTKDEVADGVNRVLQADSHVSKKVNDVSVKMRDAVGPNGSSSLCLVRFLQDLPNPKHD